MMMGLNRFSIESNSMNPYILIVIKCARRICHISKASAFGCRYRDLPLIVCEPLAGAWCTHPSIVPLAKHKKDVQSWLAIVKPFCRDQRSHRQLKRTLIRSRCDRIEKLNRFSISNFLLEPFRLIFWICQFFFRIVLLIYVLWWCWWSYFFNKHWK